MSGIKKYEDGLFKNLVKIRDWILSWKSAGPHIFGLPIPNDMDGKVLMEIFKPDSEFAKRKPVYVDPSYYEREQEDEKLKKAIKNLKIRDKI